MRPTVAVLFLFGLGLSAAERPVDPTFLYRHTNDVAPVASDLTTASARYRALFGAGAEDADTPKGVARFGELTVDPGGHGSVVSYPNEEQIYFVLSGKGEVSHGSARHPVKTEDFMYFGAGVKHAVFNTGADPLKIVVMGWRLPRDHEFEAPEKLPIASAAGAKKQVVGNHPPTTLYQLLLGATDSTRDILANGHVVTSLFTMEFAPGGTNHPHHHLRDEEIYLVLQGEGEIVAGGGVNGVEGRHAARAGDAYFYRPNATVGFHASEKRTPRKARILAVRSRFPGF